MASKLASEVVEKQEENKHDTSLDILDTELTEEDVEDEEENIGDFGQTEQEQHRKDTVVIPPQVHLPRRRYRRSHRQRRETRQNSCSPD